MKLVKIVIPVIILAVIGLFVAKSVINGKVEEKIQTYLSKSDEYADIKYGSLSVCLLSQSVTLNDVTIADKDSTKKQKIEIERMVLGGSDIDAVIPKSVSCDIYGINMGDAAYDGKEFDQLRALGYDKPKVDCHLSFKYDESTGVIGYENISFAIEDMGEFKISMLLSNCKFDMNKVEKLKKLSEKSEDEIEKEVTGNLEIFDLFQDGKSYEDVTLDEISISYVDASLMERIVKQKAEEMKIEPQAFKDQMKMMLPMIIPPDMKGTISDDMIKSITDFIDNPKSLTISSKPETPLTILEIISEQDKEKLISKMNLKLES